MDKVDREKSLFTLLALGANTCLPANKTKMAEIMTVYQQKKGAVPPGHSPETENLDEIQKNIKDYIENLGQNASEEKKRAAGWLSSMVTIVQTMSAPGGVNMFNNHMYTSKTASFGTKEAKIWQTLNQTPELKALLDRATQAVNPGSGVKNISDPQQTVATSPLVDLAKSLNKGVAYNSLQEAKTGLKSYQAERGKEGQGVLYSLKQGIVNMVAPEKSKETKLEAAEWLDSLLDLAITNGKRDFNPQMLLDDLNKNNRVLWHALHDGRLGAQFNAVISVIQKEVDPKFTLQENLKSGKIEMKSSGIDLRASSGAGPNVPNPVREVQVAAQPTTASSPDAPKVEQPERKNPMR